MRRLINTTLLCLLPFHPLAAVKIIAHRGNSMDAPENTIAAFQSALEVGAPYIECDVQLSGDGVPIIIHDDSYERTTGSKAGIAELSSQDLADLDAGGWFAASFSGTRVPTLAETLSGVHPKGAWMLELKGNCCGSREAAERVVEVISASPVSEKRFFIGSMCSEALSHVQALRPSWGLIAIIDPKKNGLEDFLHLEPAIYAVRRDLLDSALVSRVHQEGRELWVWTVDDVTDAEYCRSLGVDGVITNVPQRMRVGLEVFD